MKVKSNFLLRLAKKNQERIQSYAIRFLFIAISGVIGRMLANEWAPMLGYYGNDPRLKTFQFTVMGICAGIAILVILAGEIIKRMAVESILGGLIGFFLGMFTAWLIHTFIIDYIPILPPFSIPGVQGEILSGRQVVSKLFVSIVIGYLGAIVGMKKMEGYELAKLIRLFRSEPTEGTAKVLDTSVIIDGRIAEVCESSFIEGPLIVPRFVLLEIQHIADSGDPTKRIRGRRGLDVLKRLQKSVKIEIEISEIDFPAIKEVDAKLVALARREGAAIITNDYNLSKVAELQGVTILNVNQLANAIKPIVLPGELMVVSIVQPGKEAGQGVGFLDDGTMVVVDNGEKGIGKKVEVSVTSVLQTTAGRMIFSRAKDGNAGAGERDKSKNRSGMKRRKK